MHYVLLNTSAGGMGREAAKQQMAAAKRRCNSDGELRLTQPNGSGNYYAGFENEAHRAEFIRFLQNRNVRHSVLEPGEVKTQPQTKAPDPLQPLTDILDDIRRGGIDAFWKGPFRRQ
jgi:hypothetical protein